MRRSARVLGSWHCQLSRPPHCSIFHPLPQTVAQGKSSVKKALGAATSGAGLPASVVESLLEVSSLLCLIGAGLGRHAERSAQPKVDRSGSRDGLDSDVAQQHRRYTYGCTFTWLGRVSSVRRMVGPSHVHAAMHSACTGMHASGDMHAACMHALLASSCLMAPAVPHPLHSHLHGKRHAPPGPCVAHTVSAWCSTAALRPPLPPPPSV